MTVVIGASLGRGAEPLRLTIKIHAIPATVKKAVIADIVITANKLLSELLFCLFGISTPRGFNELPLLPL